MDFANVSGRWNRRVQIKRPNYWTCGEHIYNAFKDTENEIGRLDEGKQITRKRKLKNVLNTQRLRTAGRRI